MKAKKRNNWEVDTPRAGRWEKQDEFTQALTPKNHTNTIHTHQSQKGDQKLTQNRQSNDRQLNTM